MSDIIVIAIILVAVGFAIRYVSTKKSCSCGSKECERCQKKCQ